MSQKMILSLMMLALASSALGYSAGAPKDACDDMTPQHGVDPQKSPAPYNFQLSRKRIRGGDEITMTVEGKTASDKIRGFMIQVRQGNQRVGHFKVDPNDKFVQTLDCGGVPASAVTHRKHDEKDDKRSITVTWVAPKDLKGSVVFHNTIALNGGVFWVGAKSESVSVY